MAPESGDREQAVAEALSLARAAWQDLRDTYRGEALGRLERDYGGLLCAAWEQRDAGVARGLFEAALDRARRDGDEAMIAAVLMPLSMLALDRGDLAGARAWLTERMALILGTEQAAAIPVALEQFAVLAAAEGRPRRAVTLAAAAAAKRESLGTRQGPEMRDWADGHLSAARRALSGRDTAAAVADGITLSLEQAVRYAVRAG